MKRSLHSMDLYEREAWVGRSAEQYQWPAGPGRTQERGRQQPFRPTPADGFQYRTTVLMTNWFQPARIAALLAVIFAAGVLTGRFSAPRPQTVYVVPRPGGNIVDLA